MIFEFLNGLQTAILSLISQWGDLGVLIAMFLESSIIPIPSEAVLVTAGALGIPALNIAIFGAIGSTLGSIIGYYIGKKGGRPVVDKYGKFFFITTAKVIKVERKVDEYGPPIILIARLIPLIPFKVFSITAGILKLDLKQFLFFTLIGTFFRAYFLAVVGLSLTKIPLEWTIAAILLIIVVFLAWHFWRKKLKRQKAELNVIK